MKVYFTDFFNVSKDELAKYGACNISLLNDLPLFIDPFLLFGSDKPEYKKLHEEILDYLVFLKDRSTDGITDVGQIQAWYKFSEVKQNWFGYSFVGNAGRGLGMQFGRSLSANMNLIFPDLGKEEISATSHIEKAGLFQIGIGRDNISDFTCNLIKDFLLNYTETFAREKIAAEKTREVAVEKAYFNYEFQKWMSKVYRLPYLLDDYVLLTPEDILTKDDTWINTIDLLYSFDTVCETIPNTQLRAEINQYLKGKLAGRKRKHPTEKEKRQAFLQALNQFPAIADYYIKYKEADTKGAKEHAKNKVDEVVSRFIDNVGNLINLLGEKSPFYEDKAPSSFQAAFERVQYMKQVIENNDGYRFFYVKGQPVKREADLQLIYKFTWFATDFDVNREVNNGRGPVDYAVSLGANNKSLVEFKLASNSSLKKNLINQVGVYEAANATSSSIKVILYFTANELLSVQSILKELKLEDEKSVVLIDARADNKPSGSKA